MFGRSPRHFGPPWAQREWRGPRDPREQHEGHHQHRHGWRDQSPEQQVLRSTAAEVARLFWIASQSSEKPEQRDRLRAVLERTRTELTDLIYGSGKPESSAETATDGSQG